MDHKDFEVQILREWSPEGVIKITAAGDNRYIFVFEQQKDCQRILRHSPWTISGYLLNLQRWSSALLTIDEVDMSSCPFWVQIHRLPPGAMKALNVFKMGKRLGPVICLEDPEPDGVVFRDFARVRVNIDVSKPLVAGFWIPRPSLGDTWAVVKYEKLQSFCYTCGIVGHDMNDCGLEQVMAGHDPAQPMYHAGLGVKKMSEEAAIIRIKGGQMEVEVVRESSSSMQSVGDSLRNSGGGSQGFRKELQSVESLKEDNMDISISNKEVAVKGLGNNMEEVESLVKGSLDAKMEEVGEHKIQPVINHDNNEKEVVTDGIEREKQGFSQRKGKEVVVATSFSNYNTLVEGDKVSQLAARDSLTRTVELSSYESSGESSTVPIVKAKKCESGKFSLKRKMEEKGESLSPKPLKIMKENQVSKVEVETNAERRRPRKTQSRLTFGILPEICEDSVFLDDERFRRHLTMTSQES